MTPQATRIAVIFQHKLARTGFQGRFLLLLWYQDLLFSRMVGELFFRSSASQTSADGLGSLTMNGMRYSGVHRIGFLAVLLLSVVSLKANPISAEETPVFQLGIIIPITLAILSEAICIRLLLRRWRRPGLLIPWLMVMHLLTYPLFLGWLWFFLRITSSFGRGVGGRIDCAG